MTSKYKDTKLKSMPLSDAKIYIAPGGSNSVWSVFARWSNGQSIASNLPFFSKKDVEQLNIKHFILDKSDIEWVSTQLESDDKGVHGAVYLRRLDEYMKVQERKRIYIRRIDQEYSRKGKKRFLTDDVLDIIPSLLKQQNTTLDSSKELFEKYCEKWKSNNEHEYRSVDLDEFKNVLEEFDINKRKIVVIEDNAYLYTRNKFLEKAMTLVYSFGLDCKMIMYPSHAVFQVFQSAFCGVSWIGSGCTEHRYCDERYRQSIIDLMNEYAKMDETTFISVDSLEDKIKKLKPHCAFERIDDVSSNLDAGLRKYDYQDIISLEEYLIIIEYFNLPFYQYKLMTTFIEKQGIPVWKARIFYIIGWIQYFLHPTTMHLLEYLMEALVMKAPDEEKAEIDSVMRDIISSDYFDDNPEGEHNKKLVEFARNRRSSYVKSKHEVERRLELVEPSPIKSSTASNSPERNEEPTTSASESNSSRIEKLAADRERRNQKLAQKKNKEKEPPRWIEKPWIDFSCSPLNHESEDKFVYPPISNINCNGEIYVPNFPCFKFDDLRVLRPKFFMMNEKERLKAWNLRFTSDDFMNSERFSKSNNKEFVLRAIALLDDSYIFTEDILELIPIIMKRQRVPIKDYEEKLKVLQKVWETKNQAVFKSVPVQACKNVLDEFKVDRGLIRIIPDMGYMMTSYQILYKKTYELPVIWTLNPNGDRVLSVNHALFYLFRMLICGVNWTKEWPKETQDAIDDFKTQFFGTMTKFLKLKPGTFLFDEYVEETLRTLKRHQIYMENLVNQNVWASFEFNSVHNEEGLMSFELYKSRSTGYGFDVHEVQNGMAEIPIWLANAYIKIGFMKSFYSEEMSKLKSILVEELAFTIPIRHRMERKIEMLNYVNKEEEPKSLEGKSIENKTSEVDAEKFVKDSEVCNSSGIPIEKLTDKLAIGKKEVGTSSENLENPKSKSISNNSSTPPQTSSKPKTSRKSPSPSESKDTKPIQSESKLCDKCTRNGQKLLEAQAELQTAVNKANKYEEKAKKTTQMEKDMKKIRKENEELKKELEEMRNELKNSNDREEKSRETIQKLTENVGDLEIQVKREQQRVIIGQQENAQMKQRIDGIQLKFAINQSKIEEEFTKKDILICKLRRMHLNKTSITSTSPEPSQVPEEGAPTSSEPSEPFTSNPEEVEKSPRWHMIQWQKKKDEMTKEEQFLMEQKEMIEKLISVTKDREVKNLAEYEQTRFEGTKNIYLQTIEMNIKKIKKTDDFSNLLPIPEYPKLSPKFLEKFKEEMENQPKVSEVGLSPETDCYMCFMPYVDGEKKEFCKGCEKPVHIECAAKWRLAQKDMNVADITCGYCREKIEEKKKDNKKKKKN